MPEPTELNANKMDQAIATTARMLEVRETMRRFCGDKYAERTKPFREYIRRWMKETGKPAAEVALAVMKQTEVHGSTVDIGLAIAAAADEMEATNA